MVSAATITLNPGDSIQDAIDAASPGDVIELTAGTYTENFALVNVDGLTIRGLGSVEILTQGATSGIRMVSASNIVLERFVLNKTEPLLSYGCYSVKRKPSITAVRVASAGDPSLAS